MNTTPHNTFAEVQRTCVKKACYDITDLEAKQEFNKKKSEIEAEVGIEWITTIEYTGFQIQHNNGYYIVSRDGVHELYKSINQSELAVA